MFDGGKIIVGLIVFLGLITFPLWYNVAKGKAGYVPDLEKPLTADRCVAETEFMTTHHMDLLDEWRDKVVREGARVYTDPWGNKHEMSLSNTCLSCHENKDRFCDRCHNYMGVDPYCWDCHIIPKEVR
ncbi:MAG: sulfate reduction electron transfer complex DsrMKJOP subunit DsrJ [Candidatus Zixiibacteriota bacterium]